MDTTIRRRLSTPALAASIVLALLATPASAQTINGTVMDLNSDQPINLALVLMYTEAGDSIGMTITDERGHFSLTAPEAGSFVLLASGLGYRETRAGVFDLGDDGVMSIEYRLDPEPLSLDALVVSLNRPVSEHKLVRNGFVRRLQRGLGAFITPYDIEQSVATSTEDLLMKVPDVRVSDVRITRQVATSLTPAELARDNAIGFSNGTYTVYPRPDIGQVVQIHGPGGNWCTPTIYVDGIRTFYETDNSSYAQALTLSTMAPLSAVEAIEVYRRPAEIPPEYSFGPAGATAAGGASCGVLVVWTKAGLAPGQRPSGDGQTRVAAGAAGGPGNRLPAVPDQGLPPAPGEKIRVQLDDGVAQELGIDSPWEGTFVDLRPDVLVATGQVLGRPVGLPLEGIEVLQVERSRSAAHSVVRGLAAGAGFGVAMWRFLRFECRTGCGSGVKSAWFPSSILGLVVGALVGGQGPGTHWVGATVPGVPRR